jgi:glycosyltransferase involved in cell wall biosynthesis
MINRNLNNKKPKVSVIIPTYNRKNLVIKAIKSIIKQTYKNWELIIIDDGSTDNTREKIKLYLKNKRIKYYYKKNGGASSARNYGIKKAQGNYIAFLDSDDEFLKKNIEIQLREIKKHHADMLLCNVFEYRENKKIKNRFNFKKSFLVKKTDIFNNKIPFLSFFLKRDLAKKILFDENMPSSNDFDFVLRSSLSGAKIVFSNYRLIKTHKSIKRSRISTDFEGKIKGYQLIIKKIKKNKYQLGIFDKKELLKKTYHNLVLFYFLSKQYNNGKAFCKKIITEFPEEKYSFKTNILFVVNTFPNLGKIIFYISSNAWRFGLIQN